MLSLPPKYLFTLSFSHTFLPSEPGLGLPAEDVKSSQGAKATVNPQWLEKPRKNLQGPGWERRLTGRYDGGGGGDGAESFLCFERRGEAEVEPPCFELRGGEISGVAIEDGFYIHFSHKKGPGEILYQVNLSLFVCFFQFHII